MLAIRLQRTGRSGHAQFRVIVQDSRLSPKRGRIVAYLGSYNPHTKQAVIDSESTSKYLQNGAQPSDTVARLLKKEGIKLPTWVKLDEPKKRTVRHPEKRRSTRPAEPQAPPETPAEAAETQTPAAETEAAVESEPPVEPETSAEEPAAEETSAEDAALEPQSEEPTAEPPAETLAE